MIHPTLSRACAVAAVLVAGAVPAFAQTAPTEISRPHHAAYGVQERSSAGQAEAPPIRTGSHGAYHRPHHADD